MIEVQEISVRKLTNRRPARQRFVAAGTVAALMLLANTASAQTESGRQWQPNEQIRQAAETYLSARTQASAANTTIRAGQLDPRHRLPLCDQPLSGFMKRGATIAARTIVGVRCEGSKPWKVYLPVDVVITATVFTAARTLPRGHVIRADDIATDSRDVSQLTAGYITDRQRLIGQRVRQQLLTGRIISPAMLQANAIVSKGQSVTLIAAAGGIRVKMIGKALADGALNQRIRVKNLSSGRIVEGIVRSREQVEILLPQASNFFHALPKVSPSLADTRVSNNDR